jgi:hypothetical protein
MAWGKVGLGLGVSCAQVERQRDKFENTKVRERNERREKKSVRLPFLSSTPSYIGYFTLINSIG